MTTYETIKSAASHKDWQECARIMFLSLYEREFDDQREVVKSVLTTYIDRLISKYPNRKIPYFLTFGLLDENLVEIDAADTEFQNSIIEYYNASFQSSHDEQTTHFATSIRSCVLAGQINAWIMSHPDSYKKWKEGETFKGPTFLEDKKSINEVERLWGYVEDILSKHQDGRRVYKLSKEVDFLYQKWESSIL